MTIHDRLAANPRLTNALTIGIILIAVALIALQIAMRPTTTTSAPKLWYTTDDGLTWFADDAEKLPPFDYNGKPAVRAYVYACDAKKTKRFCAYLERIEPGVREKTAAAMNRSPNGTLTAEEGFEMSSAMQLKRPGDTEWTPRTGPAGEAIQNVRCPDNTPGELVMIFPGE